MPIAVNDIVQTVIEGRKDGQAVINVLYYRCITAAPTGTVANNLTSLLAFLWTVDAGELEMLWTPVFPDDYTLRTVRAQKIAPVREAYVENLLVDNGDVALNPLPTANLAWVMVKQTEFAGRKGRGTMHMLLPSMDWVTDGELNTEGAVQRNALAAFLSQQVTPGDGASYEPVIYHPGGAPNYHRITHVTIKQEVRVMRRRTVRVGI